ncbi:MAG: GNAT family N-acetyltransferase [Sarcina sp.]
MKYKVMIPSYEEADYIENMLLKHNNEIKAFEQENVFETINRCVKDEEGNLLGGILAYSVMWKILYIDTVWVRKDYRNKGCGTFLLNEVEKEAKKRGCYIVHLDSFDFQGKDFYLKNGYEVFGVLEDCPKGHTEYFLSKRL